MHRKKILVPLDAHTSNLKSVHYALALADRIQAFIYIVRQRKTSGEEIQHFDLLDQALRELINNARESGISLYYYEVEKNFIDEIVELVKTENISLLVFNTEKNDSEHLMRLIKPLVSCQIIQVKKWEENLKEEGKRYGTRNDLKSLSGR